MQYIGDPNLSVAYLEQLLGGRDYLYVFIVDCLVMAYVLLTSCFCSSLHL